MAKIRKEDIFDPKLFTGTTQEIQTMIEVVKQLQGEMLQLMKTSKQALAVKPTSAEGLRKQAEATQRVAQADKNLNVLEKERVRLVDRFNQTAEKQFKNNERLKQQTNERRKAIRQEVKEEMGLVGAYQKKSQTLNKLRKRYKDLVIAGKGNTREAKRLRKEVQRLDAQLKKVDASAGQYQRNVGNYGNKLKAGFGSLMSAFGITAGLFGLVRGLKNVTNIAVDFEKTIANLGAISQATDKELEALTNNARALGESTAFSASEVAELSTELAKLGFDTNQIIDSSEAILDLAAATGIDLANAASISGSTLRAFGLEAEEMSRVTSVLGVATTKSALNMEFFQTAMSKVAPVAASLGFNIEDTTALLGGLANAGFDASTAATSTRSILLKLADSGGELAQALGEPVTNLDDLIPALQKLDASGVDLAQALELTDKRSVAAFNTFLGGTDTLINLRDGITDVNDELAEMAEKQLDTVSGQLKLLNSRFQEMVLQFADGVQLTDRFKSAIAFLTRNLGTILKTLKFVTIAFVSYKTAIITTNVVLRIYRAVTVAARIASIAFSGGLKGARRAMQLLNTSIKANPIGLLVSGLTTAIALLIDFNSEADDTTEALDRVTEATERLARAQKEAFDEIDQLTAKSLALIDQELALAKKRGASEDELAEIQKRRLDTEIDGIKTKIKLGNDEIKQLQDLASSNVEARGRQAEALNRSQLQGFNFTYDQIQLRIENFIKSAKAEQDAARERLPQLRDEIKALEDLIEVKEIENKTAKINIDLSKEQNKSSKKRNNSISIQNIFLKENNKLAKEQIKLRKQLRDINNQIDIDRYNREAEDFLDIAREQAQDIDFIDPDRDTKDLIFPDLSEYNNELNLIKFATEKMARDTRDTQAQILKNQFDDYKKYLSNQVDAGRLSEAERTKLIKEGQENLDIELEILRKEYTQAVEKAEEDRVRAVKDAEEEIKALVEGTNEAQIKDLKKLEEARIAALQDTLNAVNQLLDMFQEANNRRSQQQLENIDKEIEASKRRYDELKQLSIQGNADAERSALAEERRQQELELKKQKIQKRQQLIEAGIAAFRIFAANVERDETNPLANTIRDITALTAFIGSLPTFIEGTENVGEALGKPQLPGQDGHIVRVDSSERIVDPENNQKLAGITNDELGDLGLAFKRKKFDGLRYNKLSNEAFSMMANQLTLNHQITQQMAMINRSNNAIVSAIQSIPHESWDYDKMSDAVVQKVKNQKSTHRKHYKNNSLH